MKIVLVIILVAILIIMFEFVKYLFIDWLDSRYEKREACEEACNKIKEMLRG